MRREGGQTRGKHGTHMHVADSGSREWINAGVAEGGVQVALEIPTV